MPEERRTPWPAILLIFAAAGLAVAALAQGRWVQGVPFLVIAFGTLTWLADRVQDGGWKRRMSWLAKLHAAQRRLPTRMRLLLGFAVFVAVINMATAR